MWIIRATSSIAFLSAIIFTIPLAFDVGGRTCGLAFSLSLSVFYFLYSALRLAAKDGSRFQNALVKLVGFSQWLVIATLLIWSLNKFSVDSDSSGRWAEKTFRWKTSPNPSFVEWVFGRGGLTETFSIGAWDAILRYSTPFFQIAEGFCSLLVIQAAGQITRWLVNQESGDTWMIILLIFSGSTISGSAYFLWRITTFPQIDNTDAILIGCAITAAIFLGGWGIGSGRGNPVESSLLFAYITLCIYQIFTDYMPSVPVEIAPAVDEPALPPLPPIIMASYTTLMHAFSTLPSTIHSAFNFILAVIMTITPSVIISLAYRVFVMYAAARIIPAVRESGARALSQEPSLEDSDGMSQVLGGISWFSPSILIAVYTSLLMQHFASNGSDGAGADWWKSQGGNLGGNLWRWINLALTLGCYTIELWISRHDEIRLTSHWKTD